MSPAEYYLCGLAAVLTVALGLLLRQRWVAGAPLRRLREMNERLGADDEPAADPVMFTGVNLSTYLSGDE